LTCTHNTITPHIVSATGSQSALGISLGSVRLEGLMTTPSSRNM